MNGLIRRRAWRGDDKGAPHAQGKAATASGRGLSVGFMVLAALVSGSGAQASDPEGGEVTWAERLGWGPDQRVLILHIDDAGMSHESNVGAIRSMRDGVANSVSLMMPTPWVPEFVEFARANPEVDVGLHLTLTSEWKHYRWGPVLGAPAVPGLVDDQGYLWRNVVGVVGNASADEVEREIRAQISLARRMELDVTHVDSHMGTLFATDEFLDRYVAVAIDTGIPAMLPGGHNRLVLRQLANERGLDPEDQEVRDLFAARVRRMRELGERLWAGGLPVIDDLHNESYGWKPDGPVSDEELRELKVERYLEGIRSLEPGITMMINHASDARGHFDAISGSGPTRLGDMLALTDPRLAVEIDKQGIVLTTFRELMERRKRVE